jgi:hypothetical protein
LRVLLGRGVANHLGFVEALRASEVGAALLVGMNHHTSLVDAASPPDEFLREPPVSSAEAYAANCLAACAHWRADVFWPGRDLRHITAHAGEFVQRGVTPMLVTSAPVVSLLDDKAAFAQAARGLGMHAPRSIFFEDLRGFERAYEEITASGERVCFKPVRGVFGRGFRVVREDLDIFEQLFEDPHYRIDLDDARRRFGSRERFQPMIAMPWLDGVEWSVDCFRSRDGVHFLGVPRRKVGPAGQLLDDDPAILEMSRRLAEHFRLVGLFNCQFKAHRGVPHVLEINPRPAGGVGLSRYSGVNLIELALRDALGLPIHPPKPKLGLSLRNASVWGEGLAKVEMPSGPPHAPSPKISQEVPTGRIEVTGAGVGPSWCLTSLLDVAARRNASRAYLLVSRVLGKHLPVSPARMQETHDALAQQLPDPLPGPVLFVGMGETATGLGWGVFEAWRRRSSRSDALYLHTTRYPVEGFRALSFEERHSHGPSQVLCVPSEPAALALWRSAQTLIILDDEVTTGRTAAGLADAITADGAPISRKLLVSLVIAAADTVADTLGAWEKARLADIHVEFHPNGVPCAVSSPQGLAPLKPGRGDLAWGRVGAHLAPPLLPALLERAEGLCAGAPLVYVIGAGECMHPAFVLGRALEERGFVVLVQSSTRSPVLLGAAMRASLDVEDGLGSSVPFYLHNPPPPGSCILALHERGGAESARALVEQLGAHPWEVWGA